MDLGYRPFHVFNRQPEIDARGVDIPVPKLFMEGIHFARGEQVVWPFQGLLLGVEENGTDQTILDEDHPLRMALYV